MKNRFVIVGSKAGVETTKSGGIGGKKRKKKKKKRARVFEVL